MASPTKKSPTKKSPKKKAPTKKSAPMKQDRDDRDCRPSEPAEESAPSLGVSRTESLPAEAVISEPSHGESLPPAVSQSPDLVERWRAGDQDAARLLFERYVNRLLLVVRHQILNSLRRRFDEHDVVQSAFRTLFRRTQAGQFSFQNDEDFWKLLVTIAMRKMKNRVRANRGTSRDVAREASVRETGEFDEHIAEQLSVGPDVADAIIFGELLERLCAQLNEQERRLVELRLAGVEGQQELGLELGVTDRTIRRMNSRIEEQLRELFCDDA